MPADHASLDLKPVHLADDLDGGLNRAISAWEANDEITAQSYLATAVQLAQQYGYL